MEWMAWTWPVGIFVGAIVVTLGVLTILAIFFPEEPRAGALKIKTTRGDRLFISLLSAAFINMAWISLLDLSQLGALIISVLLAGVIFRYV